MLKKKLLALVGVLAILACGACLLPPLPEQKESLPPPLASVHKIVINVEDRTTVDAFDPVMMSKATASSFNQMWMDYRVRAETNNAGQPGDAVLRITVLNKAASCVPKGNGQYCSIELVASYALTAVDGRVLLSRPQESSKNGIWQQGNSLADSLNSSTFQRLASDSLAGTAGKMLIHSANSQ